MSGAALDAVVRDLQRLQRRYNLTTEQLATVFVSLVKPPAASMREKLRAALPPCVECDGSNPGCVSCADTRAGWP